MGLNIVATRRFSLAEFAEGWDECYVIVRTATETERNDSIKRLNAINHEYNEALAAEGITPSKMDDLQAEREEKVAAAQRDLALGLIKNGKVISTNEDGTKELVSFGKEDVPTVVDALGYAWLSEIIEVATGTDRLKARL